MIGRNLKVNAEVWRPGRIHSSVVIGGPSRPKAGVSRKNCVLSFNRLKEPAVDRWPAAVAHSPAGASEPASRRRSLTLSAEPARAEPIVHFPLQLCFVSEYNSEPSPFLSPGPSRCILRSCVIPADLAVADSPLFARRHPASVQRRGRSPVGGTIPSTPVRKKGPGERLTRIWRTELLPPTENPSSDKQRDCSSRRQPQTTGPKYAYTFKDVITYYMSWPPGPFG